ncbi:hypothetical protein HN51_016592 [Arachis hypogaea]|uniref:B3 domain-containing transcription factor FUS3 n=1 Tax=Arachis duranensis TaxID=130453 RepID=A0A6P4DYT7_ARADU|nr:B3 domain-containing transcription factor FUS3 [Arachis duranensis]XP_025605946.1 B3 domain-containing transcription factor FUS3 [Arachis hypogaea]QHO47185.1 B3 domain-containing transcription factor [Arachis hypogaea]
MMMDQGQGRENLLLQKTEACAFVAGVDAHDLLPSSVTVQGNNTNTNRIITTTILHNGSSSEPGRILHHHDIQYQQEQEQEQEVGLVATFGNVHRKRRMARMRRRSSPTLMHLQFHANTTTPTTTLFPPLSSSGQSSDTPPPPPPPTLSPPPLLLPSAAVGPSTTTNTSPHVPTHNPARVIDHTSLRFLFQKELKNSDVSSLRRMVLPKKAAEAFLPPLESKEGILISMDDLDGIHVWSFKYRFWPNNNSRMYVLENTGEFVNAHALRMGDSIMVYQDSRNHNYVIQAKKVSDQDEFMEETSDMANDIFLNDYEVSKPGCFSLTYPALNDTTGMSFIYETTFSNDSPLDFLGGSMTNFSRIGPTETFGSVENLSLDDFY